MHHVNIRGLRRCFNNHDEKSVTGADHVTKGEYGEGLEEKLQDLITRMKSMSYRAKAVQQVLILKEGNVNATRELGTQVILKCDTESRTPS